MTTKKKLYLHIGHYKTGTTALQVFMARNAKALAAQGVDYAGTFRHHAKHSALAFSILHEAGVTTLMHGYSDPTPAADLWDRLCDHVRASPQPVVVVSSEEFMRIGQFPAACDILQRLAGRVRDDIELHVVVYLRNPEAHLRSWYNQLVKMNIKVTPFNTALCGEIEAIHYDYDLALRPWIRAFGTERVTLRSYDVARRAGTGADTGLMEDFLAVLGRDFGPGFTLPERDVNPRLDDRALDLVRMLQNAGIRPQAITNLRDRFVALIDAEAAIGASPDTGIEALRARSAAGIEALATLPDCNIDLDGFRARLPVAEPPEVQAANQMAGFLMQELLAERRRVNMALATISTRLDALEAGGRPGVRPGGKPGGKADAAVGAGSATAATEE